MKSEFDIVLRPIISEKADWQRDEENTYAFEVHAKANKFEIKGAIQRIYKVSVLDVRTSVVRGKIKRVGRTFGRKRSWKKAYVTLKEGQTIELFQGV
jgi:large subunit ribosomal protein L23